MSAERPLPEPVHVDSGQAARTAVDPLRLGDKSAAESEITLVHIMAPTDTNLYGTVHGGVVMKLIDDAAAAAAARHAGGPAVTVSVDRMNFLAPAHVGDLVRVTARLTRTGTTSMDAAVDVTAERWNAAGGARSIVHANLTFVAVDAAGSPRPVPRLLADTADASR